MTTTAHRTGGAPDGTEAISNIQTLSRCFTNAAGDLNGDGKAEIIVGTDAGSTAPMVKAFDGSCGSANFLFSVMADEASMTGGVRVAAGDVKGVGHDDIITADVGYLAE